MNIKSLIYLLSVTGCLAVAVPAVGSGAEAQWLTDMSKAEAKAKAEKRLILINFTGSDWCPPCRAMHAEVLTQKAFLDYAKKKLVLVEADFPRQKAQSEELRRANRALMEKHKVRAYPTFVLLDGDGKELLRHEGYLAGGPKAFIAKLEEAEKKRKG